MLNELNLKNKPNKIRLNTYSTSYTSIQDIVSKVFDKTSLQRIPAVYLRNCYRLRRGYYRHGTRVFFLICNPLCQHLHTIYDSFISIKGCKHVCFDVSMFHCFMIKIHGSYFNIMLQILFISKF